MKNNILIPRPEIKGLIFDLDGTLADTMPMHIAAFIKVAEDYGVEMTAQMIHDRAGTPTLDVIKDLSQEYGWSMDPLDPHEFRSRKTEVYLEMKKKAGPIQPIAKMVEIAKANRSIRPMGIGTGTIRSNATLALRELEITDWFDIVVTADDVIDPKPHPETFLRCVEHFGLQPHECLVYEDSPVGIKAARDGGMHAANVVSLEYFAPEV